jgi:hypothetical protein
MEHPMAESTYAINCIEECVESSLRRVLSCVIDVICLVEYELLWVKKWICEFEIKSRFSTSLRYRDWCFGPINVVRRWVGALGDVRGVLLEEKIEILLIIIISLINELAVIS